jgi:hypothetical protein
MRLFEFIRQEGGVKFMKHFKGGGAAGYKSLGALLYVQILLIKKTIL